MEDAAKRLRMGLRAPVRDREMASPAVLMVGKRWDLVAPVIAALKGLGQFNFKGPVDPKDAVSETARLLLLAPDSAGRLTATTAPRLLCVPWQSLETEDIYPDADDFVAVPCSAAELAKRMLRLVGSGRQEPEALEANTVRVGGIVLNTQTYQVVVSGGLVSLAWMEFQLLRFLMVNAGRVYRREDILQQVWGTEYLGGLRTVDVHVRRLRGKLGQEGERWLRTVRSVGYGLGLE